MRPHEEEWGNPEDFEVTVSGPELDRGIDAPRERLARYAPDMARALLANGCVSPTEPDSAWHTHDCWENGCASCSEACKATRAALAKAGVPVP